MGATAEGFSIVAQDPQNEEIRSWGGSHTKSTSAAWASCCSALVRSAASAGRRKTVSEGPTPHWSRSQRDVGRSHLELINGAGKDIPGDKVLCNTWRASILSSQGNAKKMEEMWGEGKREGGRGRGKKRKESSRKEKNRIPLGCRTNN